MFLSRTVDFNSKLKKILNGGNVKLRYYEFNLKLGNIKLCVCMHVQTSTLPHTYGGGMEADNTHVIDIQENIFKSCMLKCKYMSTSMHAIDIYRGVKTIWANRDLTSLFLSLHVNHQTT
jgi:hypothetical protein